MSNAVGIPSQGSVDGADPDSAAAQYDSNAAVYDIPQYTWPARGAYCEAQDTVHTLDEDDVGPGTQGLKSGSLSDPGRKVAEMDREWKDVGGSRSGMHYAVGNARSHT